MALTFDLIGLVVADIDASLTFYRRLGLDVPESAGGAPHVEITLPGGMRLAWDSVDLIKSIDPGWTEPTGNRISLAFACDDPAHVDRTYAELVGHGHHGAMEPWDAFWGQRYAVVHDPDGNGVDLFAPLPPDSTASAG